jgi:hypothetical protein
MVHGMITLRVAEMITVEVAIVEGETTIMMTEIEEEIDTGVEVHDMTIMMSGTVIDDPHEGVVRTVAL